MKTRIDELLQKRTKLITEQRTLLDKAEAENRALLSEEKETYERVGNEVDELESRITILKEQRERERSIFAAEGVSDTNDVSESEFRSVWDRYVRRGYHSLSNSEQATLAAGESRVDSNPYTKGTDADGGYTVPDEFYSKIINKIEDVSPIRRLANVIQTSGGSEIFIPKVTAHGAAQWVAEATQMERTLDTFAQTSLKAFKVYRNAGVSTELLADSGVNLVDYLTNQLGTDLGKTMGTAFATAASNSTTTPKGLVTSATTVGAAATTAISGDDLLDLVHGVDPAYRNSGCVFLANDAIIKAIRKLKDATGSNQYLWQPGLQAGQPDTILGYPVYSEPSMDSTMANTKRSVLFGDIKAAYWIREAGGVSIKRLDERYADIGLVAFLATMRVDGALVDANAVRALLHST